MKKVSDELLLSTFQRLGTVDATAEILGMCSHPGSGGISDRLKRMGADVPGPGAIPHTLVSPHPHRLQLEVPDGVVLIGSDAHIWPGEPSTAMRAFEYLIGELSPKVVILNGDVFDGARMSRFPSIGWEHKPDIAAEVAACQEQLRDLQNAAPEASLRWIWTLGNHDLRFETKIANALPDLAKIEGVHLKDHFPDWEPCWSAWINEAVCIKHRFKGGIHARHSNTVYSGVSIVTGHLHSLGVTPWSDYNGVRFGVDSGTLAVPYGPQFVHYTEDNPVNWRSGFVVLTFKDSRLLWPEVCHVLSEEAGNVEFRGEAFAV